MLAFALPIILGWQAEVVYICQNAREAQTLYRYEHTHEDGTVHRLVIVGGPCRMA